MEQRLGAHIWFLHKDSLQITSVNHVLNWRLRGLYCLIFQHFEFEKVSGSFVTGLY